MKSLPAWVQDLICILLIIISVLAIYCPPDLLSTEKALQGLDYQSLHLHRIRYFQEYFPNLPGWYTREAFGTPFWSNIQNVPWNPSRLLILPFDADLAFGIGVNLNAVFTALFTFLYLRTLGLSRLSSSIAGWTFACSGYFAARVMAGHLPLLEAYPALPLLLYFLEKTRNAFDRPRQLGCWLCIYGLATAGTVLSGHPQLPAYIIGTAILYTLVRLPSKKMFLPLGASVFGIGCSLFSWLPMINLLGRSSRFLPLAAPNNDVYFEYGRLGCFINPWKDGWPSVVNLKPATLFSNYLNHAYFWDTVCYFGLLPFFAALAYVTYLFIKKKNTPITLFFFLLGLLALVTALPFMKGLDSGITIFRSPARQIYLTIFSAIVLFAFSIDYFKTLSFRKNFKIFCITLLLFLHGLDLYLHDRPFIKIIPRSAESPALRKLATESSVKYRVAFNLIAHSAENRRGDDIGFFDSIILSRPYTVLITLAGQAIDFNSQVFASGFLLDPKSLEYLGVKYLLAEKPARKLHPSSLIDNTYIYELNNPLSRIEFYPFDKIRLLPFSKLIQEFQDWNNAEFNLLTLEPSLTISSNVSENKLTSSSFHLKHQRISPDEMEIEISTPQSGYIKILESWDPGWEATLNDNSVPIEIANGFGMAIQAPPKKSTIKLFYKTPFAKEGLILSILCLAALLGASLWIARKTKMFET